MFKPGDVVRKKDGTPFGCGKYNLTVVKEPTHPHYAPYGVVWVTDPNSYRFYIPAHKVELVPPIVYEDNWTMWQEGVEVPPDADVARSEKGSVVCFRRVKGPVVKEFKRSCQKTYKGYETCEADNSYGKSWPYLLTFIEVSGELIEVKVEKR